AVVRFPHADGCVVTVDMLMEGVDFLLPEASPERIGWKSLAVNVSDLAAMAALPVACVVSVALPRRGGFELGRGLMQGISRCAERFQLALAGGDTNTWDGPLVISITCLGEPVPPGVVRRNGARPGDWIMTTGQFGGSLGGKHLDFLPRVDEALALHRRVALHAMIDVSDGLAADLRHILEESQVGAIVDATAIPISAAALGLEDGKSPLAHALGDGEDFELIFTVSADEGAQLLADPPCTTPLTRIGEITAAPDLLLRTSAGETIPLEISGWKHGFQ
ncbi:MAG: thiamine-monophosphate kinase, partial [Planctomycetes bacterium]|nr:thiamine-monophosphate kinase [Planctomycetota bacterium]